MNLGQNVNLTFQNDAADDDDDGGDAGTTHPSWQVLESITPREQISRSGNPSL